MYTTIDQVQILLNDVSQLTKRTLVVVAQCVVYRIWNICNFNILVMLWIPIAQGSRTKCQDYRLETQTFA